MKKALILALSALMIVSAPTTEAAGKRHVVAKHKTSSKATKTHVARVAKKKHASVAHRKARVVAAQAVPQSTPMASAAAAAAGGNDPSALRLSQNLASMPDQARDEVAVPDQDLELRSAVALVVDQATGKPLYAKNPDLQTPIASITKLMTSVVVLDANQPLDEKITITDDDVDRLKYTHSRVAVGTTLTRGELLHLALIASENRAAAALARNYPGGRAACIEAMNRKAAALGMTSTHYVDGTGLNSANQSTAIDLAKLVNVAASQYPLIRQITSTGEYGVELPGYKVVKVRKGGKVRRVSREVERHVAFHNTNALTRNPDWEIGLSKTGFINEAGHCLVMQARIGERKVIMVLLDSVGKMTRIGDANRVRRWLENESS